MGFCQLMSFLRVEVVWGAGMGTVSYTTCTVGSIGTNGTFHAGVSLGEEDLPALVTLIGDGMLLSSSWARIMVERGACMRKYKRCMSILIIEYVTCLVMSFLHGDLCLFHRRKPN
ncbi:hypothetical protein IQ07DRAFT_396364 [Pyrenochaeta sp. DS3sAY3a]|nr:hypothetical protein IQ07DRAFT_396364 [Pyrenochaeta sp. DS3sAY3a]